MTLKIDATDVQQAIFRVKQTMPVIKAGPMVLLSPAWLPGVHAPTGQIEKLTGLKIRAGGELVPWTRDTVDMWAFHINVPERAGQLDIEFQFTSPTDADQDRIVAAPNMLNLQWNHVSLYPAGYFTRRIPVQVTATYPEGWTAVAGLLRRSGAAIMFIRQQTMKRSSTRPLSRDAITASGNCPTGWT